MNTYSVHAVVEMLKVVGRQKVILMTDGEPSIKALAEAAAKQIGTGAQLQHAAKETHGPSNGAAERAVVEVAPGRYGPWCTLSKPSTQDFTS